MVGLDLFEFSEFCVVVELSGVVRKEYAKAKAKRSSVDISRDKSFQSDDRPRQSNVLPAVIISG